MKRKIFALMLVFALALTVLSGCEGIANNGGSSGGGAEDAAGDTGDSADAGADANADTGADAGAVTGDFEPMELSVSMSTNEVESPAKVFKTFADGVTEKTGGAVTFNIYYGSTFCGPQEELYQIQSGSLDMCILQTLAYGDVLPLLVSIPQMWPGDDAGAKNYFDTIFVDDPETSKYIGDSLSAFNVHSLLRLEQGFENRK
jgi:TRAP-type C4-dicarboxylate transport system substrate-binding protein